MLADERLHVVRGGGEDAVRRGDPDAPEQVLALVFHQLHGGPSVPHRAGAPLDDGSASAEAAAGGRGEMDSYGGIVSCEACLLSPSPPRWAHRSQRRPPTRPRRSNRCGSSCTTSPTARARRTR